jgi:hypothetical protein
MPLTEIFIDLSDEQAAQLARRIPSLTYINAHKRDYVLAMADDLRKSLGGQPANLRKYAFGVNGFRYLAVPHAMTRHAAESFAAKQGARLACPATRRRFVGLCDALRRYCANEACYRIGAVLDSRTRSFRWLSGDPWTDVGYWDELSRQKAYSMGGVGLNGWQIVGGDYSLVWSLPDDARLLILEWEGPAAKDGNAP